MKKLLLTCVLLCSTWGMLCAKDVEAWTTTNTKGEFYTSADGTIKTYARPDGYTLEDSSPRFNVLVNGEAYAGLYTSRNNSGGSVSFGYFDFKDGTPIDVYISCRKPLGDYDLIPHGAEVYDVEMLGDKILKFSISKANQNITIVSGGNYLTGDVLHLFCNDIIEEPAATPTTAGYKYDKNTKTYCFGPGVYHLSDAFSNGMLTASNGRNIYLAGGAVVYGTLGMGGAGSRIYGHGMVVTTGGQALTVSGTSSGEVDGIICHKPTGETGWQTTYTYCTGLTVKNMKVIATTFASTDGIDIQRSQNISFDNCFIRSCDDCIAIKGLDDVSIDPQSRGTNSNLSFNRMQLWSDANNAFGIGAETIASAFENIRFTDSDILCHDDNRSYDGEMVDRSAINITALEGTYFHNIRIDNIRVYRCIQLIQLGFQDSFWYNTLLGNMSWPGEMRDIHFSNINCMGKVEEAQLANNVRLRGWKKEGTPTKYIHDIHFTNVMINGELLNGWDNENLITNNTAEDKLVYDLYFNDPADGIEGVGISRQSDNCYYDLTGRRVENPGKGLYILNGKKIIK